METAHHNLKPHKPDIITSGVVEVVGFFDQMDPREAVSELLNDQYVLVEDYYHNGLQVLEQLQKYFNQKYNTTTFQGQRKFRAAYQKASSKLLLMVVEHELVVKKSPKIGWFKKLYPDELEFLISFPNVQGLNSSWQYYINGVKIEPLDFKIHPYYGIYFPTRFDHISLFRRWLSNYEGKPNTAFDVGVGSGVLSFQLLQHGFSHVIGSDTNSNAIISTSKDALRLGFSENLKLRHGDLFAKYDNKVDLVVFNPPWIQARHVLEEGIDTAIYYKPDLFDRFFQQATLHLHEHSKLVILFSTLGQIAAEDDYHPIEKEITMNNRFKKDLYLKQNVKSASNKTNRQDWRDEEHVELWELSML